MKLLLTLITLSSAFLAGGCSSEAPVSSTNVEIRIKPGNSLSISGTSLTAPFRFGDLRSILGEPSKSITSGSETRHAWGSKGVWTFGSSSGIIKKINLRLRKPATPDISPSSQFNGSIETPNGTVNFGGSVFDLDGKGYTEFMDSRQVMIQAVDGIEVLIGGSSLILGNADFASISLTTANRSNK